MKSDNFGFGASLIDVLNPPANPWLKTVSGSKVVLPRGVRIRRNSSDQENARAAECERHAELRKAKEKLYGFIDLE